MIEVDIPGFGRLSLKNLVLDYNGTMALHGEPIAGVRECLQSLAPDLSIHAITADNFGTVRERLAGYPCTIEILARGGEDLAKQRFVERLGAEGVVCIGNGRNDRRMLEAAALGIVVVGREGAAGESLRVADIAVASINDALDLLLHPLRLVATLRS